MSGANTLGLSVGERLPKKVVWSFNGVEFSLECSDGLVAKNFQSNIFVIEAPYEIKKNRAYVLSADGHRIADLPKNKGDVQLFIKIINDTEFIRDGLDLIYKKKITLKESLTGFDFDIKHLNGKTYSINNDAGNIIQPNYSRDINNLGMKRQNKTGKLIIVFELIFPDKLTNQQMTQLKKIL